MDIFSHAVVGYSATDSIWGVMGSVICDVDMIKRKPIPSVIYKFTHSITFVLLISVISNDMAIGVAYHILVDLFTHGSFFQPRLLFPFSNAIMFNSIVEWEFFNKTWRKGVILCCVLIVITYL